MIQISTLPLIYILKNVVSDSKNLFLASKNIVSNGSRSAIYYHIKSCLANLGCLFN